MKSDPSSIQKAIREQFDTLSAAQQKVAEYLLRHSDECALLTAKQISREAGVSETTVIRLSYALGFGSFTEMQQRLRERMLSGIGAASLPTAESTANEEAKELVGVLEKDISILKQALSELNVEEFWKAVEALIKADRVVVAGYRISYSAAHWFSFTLGGARDNVQLCPSEGDDYAKLLQLTERSVAIVISVPRYAREIVKLAKLAKEQKATLIAVTDRQLSPVGRMSDIVLTTDVNVDTGLVSVSSVISLLHLLLYGIKMKDRQRFQSRQQRLEQLYAVSDVFTE